ncbi:AraC family transcriptional regulator [Cellvibrio sp. pealriver]|uniref:AraC family transcriptional regulator n=1 Tax=Cellvibrio sp. pealriver TaxID=1622269 RepID=UPI000AC53BCE|nr:AraC family transcriptional regulator [Cellvibrio sp. pealriver]
MATADAHAAYKPQAYIEIDTPLVSAQGWPLTLIELALNRGIEEHKLLRGTGIFRDDIAQKNILLSPQQCFQLIANIQKYNLHRDLSFLIGSRLLLDNPTPAQIALTHARNLQEALDIVIRYNTLISPLLKARLDYQQDRVMMYWQDSCGAASSEHFLLEMMATSLSALSRWKSAQPLPWQFYFCCDKPEHIEQYQVHLPGQIHFNAPVNAMSIAREYLHTPWQKVSADVFTRAEQLAEKQLAKLDSAQGFLAETYDYLHNNIHRAPNLDQSAADFGMSSASFKRKLKKHNSHFQAQYDQVRRDLTLMWLEQGGWSTEQIAHKLHFYDVANLRRAFKKWTGAPVKRKA